MATSHEREQSLLLTGSPVDHMSASADGSSSLSNLPRRFLQEAPAEEHHSGYMPLPSTSFVAGFESQEPEGVDLGDTQSSRSLAASNRLGMATQDAQRQECARLSTTGSSSGSLLGNIGDNSSFSEGSSELGDHDDQPRQTPTSTQTAGQCAEDTASDLGLVSLRSRYDKFVQQYGCTSIKTSRSTKLSWHYVAILVLAAYSTAMSGLFCIVAVTVPRYGRKIRTDGFVTISGAVVLTTFLAKTIELSFVTIVIALLGQVLARKAYDKKKEKGITLAEIGMRSWVLQPGTLITHWESVRYAGITVLGITSVLSTILAALYVTSANALVQPQLRFVRDQREMRGNKPRVWISLVDFLE